MRQPSRFSELPRARVGTGDSCKLNVAGCAIACLAGVGYRTDSYLLTNYHVIDGQRFVFIKQGDKVFEVIVVSGDEQSDRSILQVQGGLLSPVAGLRGFEKLRVGEEVFTIGSPAATNSCCRPVERGPSETE
jgi:S1-C subfamily serine protease